MNVLILNVLGCWLFCALTKYETFVTHYPEYLKMIFKWWNFIYMNEWSIFLATFVHGIYWYVAKKKLAACRLWFLQQGMLVRSMGFGIIQTWICILSLPWALWPPTNYLTSSWLNFLIAKDDESSLFCRIFWGLHEGMPVEPMARRVYSLYLSYYY